MKSKLTRSSGITLGLDLGDKKHALCALNVDGEVIDERSIVNSRDALRRLSEKYPQSRIACEVGSHSPWISRFLIERDHEVLVANARKLKAIYQNERKSDRRDAEILARLARFDPQLLYPIKHGSEKSQRDLLQIKLRDNLVRQRVDIISSVRFTLKSLGLRIPSPNTNYFACHTRRLLEKDQADILSLIEPSLLVVDSLTEQIKELSQEIEMMAEQDYPECQVLQQITGVGTLTALTFILVLDDPDRFARPRDVGAFLGLVPRRDQSGDCDKQLRVTKAGNAYLRRLLVGAAQYILGPHGPDCDLKAHGLKLAERGGGRAKKKAVVAIARKLSVLLFVLWRDQTAYRSHREEALPA